jgi:hypothetical protein
MRGLRAIKNNKGSSIIMVLLAMAFISILGTILLLMAFTGYEIKAAQAKGERAFYNAETALDEVRAGVQGIVSDCIERAYTLMLQEYRHETADLLEEVFRQNFRYQFLTHPLISQINYDYIYNGSVLWSFVSDDERTTGNISEAGFTGTLNTDAADVFILENIMVSHRSADGFVSTISSDITVIVPDFSYVRAAYTISGVPEFALIATDKIELLVPSSAEIIGNAYAGGFNLENISVATGIGELIISGGALISRGDVIVDGGALTVSGADLWANKIYIGENNSSVSLNGSTFVADDLVLQGMGASATLSGRYYGFGNTLMLEPGDLFSLASVNSSIIVNGLNSTLNMENLESLVLAGHSFIETPGNNDIFMGQSVSVKSDQLAFLIPSGAITNYHMNPIIYTEALPGDQPVPEVNLNMVLWTIGGEEKTLNDYVTGFHTVDVPILAAPGQRLLFLFMEFEDRPAANIYFRDYFSQNTAEIRDYINQYLNPDFYRQPQSAQTSGYYYTSEPINLPAALDSANLTNISSRLRQMYNNIIITLSSSIPPPALNPPANPYEYIVNAAAVDLLANGTHEFSDGDTVRAVIIKCNGGIGRTTTYTNSLPADVNLILSTGNVVVNNVSGSFEGLIISNGYIQLQNSVTATPAELIPSMSAKNVTLDAMFSDFLNLSITDDASDNETTMTSWAMNELVFFENWRRR